MMDSKSQIPKVYEALADAFIAEGVTQQFVLMGDGNMHWSAALAERGASAIYARHEHCAVSMAMSYANATGEVGVASVTCGPGLTQIMTALSAAVRANLPLVIFAGESPLSSVWYNQEIDQAPFVTATGARYIQIHAPALFPARVQEAFRWARLNRRPVVIGMPFDLQQNDWPGKPYVPSAAVLPDIGRIQPDPERVQAAAELVRQSRRVIVLGGRGAKLAGSAPDCLALAHACGALLAETLPVRGLFHEDEWTLGVAGGFSSRVAREAFGAADLVIAVGASLTHHTRDGGKLFPKARIIQIDHAPTGITQGFKTADCYIGADAKAGVAALTAALGDNVDADPDWRAPAMAKRIKEEPADDYRFEEPLNGLDPRDVVAALDAVIPREWDLVNASGHCSYFTAHMHGRSAERFHTIREFGAIGNGLSYAIGVAAARPDNPVVLFDGDGGFLMHAQELETIARHNLNILICILNDGAYGSEIHKLRSDGLSDVGSVFGRGDLGAVARGFGLQGTVITDVDGFGQHLETFRAGSGSMLWDIHISDQVTSPVMRRAHPPKQ